jgi:hypothetical protein
MMRTVLQEQARLDLAYDSLDGVTARDALGAQFFMIGKRDHLSASAVEGARGAITP